MPINCTVPGPWDAVTGTTPYMSKQQWQKAFLRTLCEALEAATGVPSADNCEIAGIWSTVTGTGMPTDQEFYTQSLATLCALKDAF